MTSFSSLLLLLSLLVLASSFCHGFTFHSSPRARLIRARPSSSNTRLQVSASTPLVSNNSTEATAWECDEDANCVQVPACDEQECRTSLDVRIHNKWYDLSGTLHTNDGVTTR